MRPPRGGGLVRRSPRPTRPRSPRRADARRRGSRTRARHGSARAPAVPAEAAGRGIPSLDPGAPVEGAGGGGVRARGGRRHPARCRRAHLPRRQPQARAHRRRQRHVPRARAGCATLDATRRLVAALGTRGRRRSRDTWSGPDAAADPPRPIGWLLSGDGATPRRDDHRAPRTRRESDEFAAELALVRAAGRGVPRRSRHRRGAADEPRRCCGAARGCSCRAGVLHAYLDGLGVELMAASDNVLRGGLTPKHVDVGELLACSTRRPDRLPVAPTPTHGRAGSSASPPTASRTSRCCAPRVRGGDGDDAARRGRDRARAPAGRGRRWPASGGAPALAPAERRARHPGRRRVRVRAATGEVFIAQPGRGAEAAATVPASPRPALSRRDTPSARREGSRARLRL